MNIHSTPSAAAAAATAYLVQHYAVMPDGLKAGAMAAIQAVSSPETMVIALNVLVEMAARLDDEVPEPEVAWPLIVSISSQILQGGFWGAGDLATEAMNRAAFNAGMVNEGQDLPAWPRTKFSPAPVEEIAQVVAVPALQ